MRTGSRSYFDRRNALVDNGWLRALSPTALKVWSFYERHANAEGHSRPGEERLCEKVGHEDPRNLRRARKELVALGLLEITSEGGGADTCQVRLLTPGIAPQKSPRKPRTKGYQDPGSNSHITRGETGPGPNQPPGVKLAHDPGSNSHITRGETGTPFYKDEGKLKGRREWISACADAAPSLPGISLSSDRPLANGNRPIGPHQQLVNAFTSGWEARYGARREFGAGKDGRSIKSILQHTSDLQEALAIVEAFLADDDPFLIKRTHRLEDLASASSISTYRARLAGNGSAVIQTPHRGSSSGQKRTQHRGLQEHLSL